MRTEWAAAEHLDVEALPDGWTDEHQIGVDRGNVALLFAGVLVVEGERAEVLRSLRAAITVAEGAEVHR